MNKYVSFIDGKVFVESETNDFSDYPHIEHVFECAEDIEAWRLSEVDGELVIKFPDASPEEARSLLIDEQTAQQAADDEARLAARGE